jgi:hypothetical protein
MQQMMKPTSHHDSAQAMQRVRVGLTGLAMVLVLIGLASAIFTAANRDGPISSAATNSAVVANITDAGNVIAGKLDAPVAELGVAPSTGSTEDINAAAIAKQQEAQRAAAAHK